MIISRDTQKAFYVIHQSLQIKNEEKIGIEGNHLEMISINYQKLTANMLTRGNGRYCHEGKAETATMLPLVRILIPGPHPRAAQSL